MNSIAQVLSFLVPWLLAALIPFVAVMALVVGRKSAGWWVAGYFVLIFYFPNASWGLEEVTAGNNFYTRGTGLFYFSAVNLLLWGLVLQAFFARRFARPLPVSHNLRVPALMFVVILIGNVFVGMAMPELRWFQVIGYSGLLNVANFMFVFYVLMAALREPADLDRFINLLLFCSVTRGLWGVFRFAALGGDPANFYANFQHIDVRITFFDANDSLLATLALFIVGWRLAMRQSIGLGVRSLYWLIVLLELFIVIFSYRRVAWGGFALAAILFAVSQRPTLRWGLLAGYMVVGLPALVYKLVQRGGPTARGNSLLERVAPDIMQNGHFVFTTGRFSELYAAWLSIKGHLLIGLGAWGQYDAFRFSELAWHRGDFSWMHSGMLHIILKTGLIGASVVVTAICLYFVFVYRAVALLHGNRRAVLLAGAGGVLFMIPIWAVGTPVIEFRSMQLLALCFALPYLAVAAARRAGEISAEPVQRRRASLWSLAPHPSLRSLSHEK